METAPKEPAARGPFRCLTCGIVDAVGCQQSNCPERPELAPAPELNCTNCPWQGAAKQTNMFGCISGLCPDCGAETVSAPFEANVLQQIADVAIASADSHPQLTAGIVRQLAPENVDVLHLEPECSICNGTSRISGQPCVCTFGSQVSPGMAKPPIPLRPFGSPQRPGFNYYFMSGDTGFLKSDCQDRRFTAIMFNDTKSPFGLTFNMLRDANGRRLPQFKNRHGQAAHSTTDGSDWCPAQWLQALVGELGEYARVRVLYESGAIDREAFVREANKELADVQCYLDLLARRALDDVGRPDPNSAAGQLQMVIADLGEYANARKKLERGDFDLTQFGKEGLVALGRATDRLVDFSPTSAPPKVLKVDPVGVDLAKATTEKFNEVSRRVGSDVFLPAPAAAHTLSPAAYDVLAERTRQVEAEGWTPEHDSEHGDESLAAAAACYAMPEACRTLIVRTETREGPRGRGDCPVWGHKAFKVPTWWPKQWAPAWWKPKDRRRDLVRAGALILAEIERIDRTTAQRPAEEGGDA